MTQGVRVPLYQHRSQIEQWFAAQAFAPIACSMDIRANDYKAAVVDTNAYPMGFSHLQESVAIEGIATLLQGHDLPNQRVAILAEAHTRNVPYYDSLSALADYIRGAGYQVWVCSTLEGVRQATPIQTNRGSLTLYPLQVRDGQVVVDNQVVDLLWLNHDGSEGYPKELATINHLIMPPLSLGWWRRKKSNHFNHYEQVVRDFCQQMAIDELSPFMLMAKTEVHRDVDFHARDGLESLAKQIDKMLAQLTETYSGLDLDQRPYVVVKPNSGTYGMGVAMVASGEELLRLSHQAIAHLSRQKGNRPIREVIIQEGIETHLKIDNHACETVMYVIGSTLGGGFFRGHATKGFRGNLNTPGMVIKEMGSETSLSQYYLYTVLARLGALALGRELGELGDD